MPLEIRRIAEFLEISIAPPHWDAIIQHCTFDYMKTNATKSVPLGGLFWDGGAETFINKGTNGRWRDVLTAKDIEHYEQRTRLELGEQCAQWLSTGTLQA